MSVVGIGLVMALACMTATADPIVLQSLNSSASIDPSSQAGMYNWTVDGVNNLYQQWFWYRIGNESSEKSIDTLNLVSAQSLGGLASLSYVSANRSFEVDITYSLLGGRANTHTSDLGEQIAIRNLSNGNLDFHFFQYSDFDLNGNSAGDTASHPNKNTIDQSKNSQILSETVVTPAPNHWQIDYYPNILALLDNTQADTLSDGTTPLGPGDPSWAFEWDDVIGVNQDLVISKDKLIRPIPEVASSLGLFGLALVGIRFISRRCR